MKKLLFTALASAFSLMSTAQEAPAFPGAEGFGRYTTGGRGGMVIHVTNLNDSGTGSLRWALSQSGKKIIVFDVSGNIDLKSQLNIPSNVTIAGQTAPGQGITLRYYTVYLDGDNVIMRFIRVRRGNAKDVNDGADASWGRHHKNIIFDHCSYSWSIDECASFYDNQNFTMQWCTIGESLNNAGHDKGAHGYGGIWGGRDASFHHNLLLHHTNRTPRLCGSRYGYWDNSSTVWTTSYNVERDDVRNCVIYNWGTGNGAYGGMGGHHNLVNNYYKYGPATKNKYRVFQCSEGTGSYALPKGVYGKFYINGNYVHGKGENYDWQGVITDNGSSVTKDTIKSEADFGHGTVTTHSAAEAFTKVLKYAGASYVRDDVDRRYADEALNGTATYKGSVTNLAGIIDTQEDVGGYPELTQETRPEGYDTDQDGMPDEWELLNGLNPNDGADANQYTLDTEKQWYTNVEVYLNSIVEPIMKARNMDAMESVDEYYPKANATGIADTMAPTATVAATSYYNLLGQLMASPQDSIYIKVERMADGRVVTTKVLNR